MKFKLRKINPSPLIVFFKNMFTKELSMTLTAFVITVFVYIYVGLENREEKIIKIPIVISSMGQNLSVSSDIPSALQLTLLGGRNSLSNIDYGKLSARINLKGAKIGDNDVSPVIDGYLPSSVQIISIIPEHFTVKIDERISKLVSVSPEFVGGEDALGDWAYSISPRVERVQGPRNILNELITLRTQPIDVKKTLSNVSGDENARIEKIVKISNNISPYIDIDREKEFSVIFRKNEGYVKKSIFNAVKINFMNLKDNLEMKEADVLSVKNIVVNVQKKKEQSFQLKDIYFYVDLSGIVDPGSYRANILYTASQDIEGVTFSPLTLRVTIVSKSGNPLGDGGRVNNPEEAVSEDIIGTETRLGEAPPQEAKEEQDHPQREEKDLKEVQ